MTRSASRNAMRVRAMEFIINGKEPYGSAREAAEEIAEWLREDDYDASIDKSCGPIVVKGVKTEASAILKRDSHGIYLRGFYEWVSGKTAEYQAALENLGQGDKAMIGKAKAERTAGRAADCRPLGKAA